VEAVPGTDALYEDTPLPKLAANMRIEPLELQWVRIGCSYRAATGTKVVLQDVYGKASPGEMQVRGLSFGRGGVGVRSWRGSSGRRDWCRSSSRRRRRRRSRLHIAADKARSPNNRA
jgi:hypothetical protein